MKGEYTCFHAHHQEMMNQKARIQKASVFY